METETQTQAGPVVIDRTRADNLPTGHVLVGNAAGRDDRELADVAGYCHNHFGYAVTRYEDGTATVHLYND